MAATFSVDMLALAPTNFPSLKVNNFIFFGLCLVSFAHAHFYFSTADVLNRYTDGIIRAWHVAGS